MNASLETLGFASGESVFVETTPEWYGIMAEENGLDLSPDLPADHAHLFFASKREVYEFLEEYMLKEVRKSVWISWPNKASGMKTDLDEQIVKEIISKLGWVAGDVVEIDDKWSGLKFLHQ